MGGRLAQFHFQRDGDRHAVQRQVARHLGLVVVLHLDLGRAEGHLRVGRGAVQELVAEDVLVQRGIDRADGRQREAGLDGRVRGIGGIQRDRAGDAVDHAVADREAQMVIGKHDLAVAGIDHIGAAEVAALGRGGRLGRGLRGGLGRGRRLLRIGRGLRDRGRRQQGGQGDKGEGPAHEGSFQGDGPPMVSGELAKAMDVPPDDADVIAGRIRLHGRAFPL